jgi:chitinase
MPGVDEKIYQQIPALKARNPNLKVWVSVGGWTFNDNGTVWQPVFGDIASEYAKRMKFANNLASFMMQYGFDGADLDW